MPPGPHPEERTENQHHSLEDRQTASLPGKGLRGGCYLPAPPVPGHTRLLLLQHKAGDLQHIEENHAHKVCDRVPLVLQALLEPAQSPQSQHSGPQATEGPWLLPKPTSYYQQVVWVQEFLPLPGQCGSSL